MLRCSFLLSSALISSMLNAARRVHPDTADLDAELVSLDILDRVNWQRSASGADVESFALEYVKRLVLITMCF